MTPADPSLLAIFSAEQAEHVSAIRSLVGGLAAGDPVALDGLLRHLHTLKGAARAVGLGRTELLTHQSEEVLAQVRRGAIESIETVCHTLDRTMDAVEDILAAALAQKNAPDSSDLLQHLLLLSGQDLPATLGPKPPSEAVVSDRTAPQSAPADLLRINARALDELIRESSQMLIDSTAETSRERLAAYATHLADAFREWGRLRRTSASAVHEFARHPEFQPIAECLAFIDNRLTALNREAHAVHETSGNSSRSLRDRAARVYQGACRIRTTPAEAVFGSFGPMVRDLAKEEGKQIAFRAEGLDTYADLLVLQGLKDSVMHLLRNAVSHGIEPANERIRAGKPEEGIIRLNVTSRGDRLSLSIEDDGSGLDYQGVAREARRRGLVSAGEEEHNAAEMAKLLFQPGFSTSRRVTGVSGRGIGLSIVQSAVNRLRGEISIVPRSGGGTRVIL
ncbi:MAG TPA: ATP-binding protein, partial [Bryobacteraceae bacterium]